MLRDILVITTLLTRRMRSLLFQCDDENPIYTYSETTEIMIICDTPSYPQAYQDITLHILVQ